MAFGTKGTKPGVSVLRTQTPLQQLLEEINFQRTKEMRQQFKDDSGFIILPGTTYWTDLFVRSFLFQSEPDHSIDSDDLLFFVRKKHVKGTSRHMPKYETDVDVFRKDSRKLPIGDPDVDWEETVYLNLIIHQFNYTLTLAICTRTSPKELQVLRRHSQRVYASPSRRKMDTKGDGEEMTYPHVCFMVDNFDEVFSDIVVRDGEMVCVELVASDRDGSVQGVIFLGSIRYDALKKVYDSRQSSLSSKVAQRMTFGLFNSGGPQTRCEFVRMKGPQGKGHAEMAVTKPKGSGVETPTSEPGFCATDMWDEWDEDPDNFYNYRHQRRLSDPSSNLNYYSRYGWKTKTISNDGCTTTVGAKARSENEGLDSIANELSEIEAGDLRDDRPASLVSAIAADSIIINKYNITSIRQPTTSIRLIPSTLKQTQKIITSNKDKNIKIEGSEKNKTTKCCNCFNTNRKSSTKSDNISEQMSDIYCRICDDINSPACLANVPYRQLNGIFFVKNHRNLLNLESELEIPNIKYDCGDIKTICNINSTLLSSPSKHTLENVSKRNINNHDTNIVEQIICVNSKKNEEYELADDATSYNGCHDTMVLSALHGNHDNIKIFNEIDSNLRSRSVQGKVELPAKEQKHLHTLGELCNEKEFNHPSTLLINKNITNNEISCNIHSIRPLNNYNKSNNALKSSVLDKQCVCKNDNNIEITSNDLEITDKNNNVKQRHLLINRNYSTLPKMKKNCLHYEHQHQDYLLNKLCNKIPMHTTPDGTNIYYWCDLPKKTLKELDDGAYNPLWATKGFTQTFHFWKEHRRQQSIPLNAFLTYVKLPWWSIAKDLLDHRETPILTF